MSVGSLSLLGGFQPLFLRFLKHHTFSFCDPETHLSVSLFRLDDCIDLSLSFVVSILLLSLTSEVFLISWCLQLSYFHLFLLSLCGQSLLSR